MSARYLVGCAGQFVQRDDGTGGLHYVTDDLDEAVASCDTGPVGVEVYDSITKTWIGPTCAEEIEEAKAKIAARSCSPDKN